MYVGAICFHVVAYSYRLWDPTHVTDGDGWPEGHPSGSDGWVGKIKKSQPKSPRNVPEF